MTIPEAHVEAGLPSVDRRVPEEIKCVVTNHLATWCFAPTPTPTVDRAPESEAPPIGYRELAEGLALSDWNRSYPAPPGTAAAP
jgi:hypothetical protein